MDNQKRWSKRSVIILAASVVAVLGLAAFTTVTHYFRVSTQQDGNELTYQFDIAYDLVPGRFKITPGYVPEGYMTDGVEQEETNKLLIINMENLRGVSISYVMTTSELDAISGELVLESIENVEKVELSGMEAHIITFEEADKYRKDTQVFMFNEEEGYVLRIYSYYGLPREELIRILDNLTIERIGDADLVEEGNVVIPPDESTETTVIPPIYDTSETVGIGETVVFESMGSVAVTVNSYEYMDSIAGYPVENFYDYPRVAERLNADGTLKPYTRECVVYEWNGDTNVATVIEEEAVGQVFLKVNLTMTVPENFSTRENYDGTDLSAQLDYFVLDEEGNEVKYDEACSYRSIPSEYEHFLSMEAPIYLSEHDEYTDEIERGKRFFWRQMTAGEALTYDLIFVVDEDRKEDIPYLCYYYGREQFKIRLENEK